MIQFIARLNLILRVIYDAMPPYGSSGGKWVNYKAFKNAVKTSARLKVTK